MKYSMVGGDFMMNTTASRNHHISIGNAIFSAFMYLSLIMSAPVMPAVSVARDNGDAWKYTIVFLISVSLFFLVLKKITNFSFGIFENITIKGIALAIGCAILGYLINASMNLFVLEKVFKLSYDSLQFSPQLISSVPAMLYACLLGPITEELLMRGYVLGGLRNRYGTAAIFISSALFAVLHLNIVQGINGFVMGVMLGVLYIRTGSIFNCMLAHIINNSVAMIVISYCLQHSIGI